MNGRSQPTALLGAALAVAGLAGGGAAQSTAASPRPAATGPAELQLDVQLASRADSSSHEAELDAALGAALTTLADRVEVTLTEGPLADPDTRLAWSLRAGRATLAVGTEQRNGTATCRIPGGASAPPPLRPLLRRFGYEARTGWLSVDVPGVTGNLAARPRDGGPVDEALMLGALACGELALFVRPTPTGDQVLTVRCPGGLLLPATLALLAGGDADQEGVADRPLSDDLDHWLLIACAAHDDERREALRQLGRFSDRRAVEALEGALFEESLRDEAALALAHLGTPEAVAVLCRHAPGLDPGLVADAVWMAMPEAARRETERRIATAAAQRTERPHAPAPQTADDWLWFARTLTLGAALGLACAWLVLRSRLGN